MTLEEKEKLRHEKYMNDVEKSKKISDLPKKINQSMFINSIGNITKCDEKKVSKDDLITISNLLVGYDKSEFDESIMSEFDIILKKNYPDKDEEEIKKIKKNFQNNKRIRNLLAESLFWEIKRMSILYRERKEKHEYMLKIISSAVEIDQFPIIGVGDLNSLISKDLYPLFNKERLKVEYTGPITKNLLLGKDMKSPEITEAIKNICINKEMTCPLNNKNLDEKIELVKDKLEQNCEIEFLVEEILAKEKRLLQIYKMDHEYTMDQINDATRISQLPSNLSISKITSYLSGNSMIEKKGFVVPSNCFIETASKLLEGYKITDDEVKSILKESISDAYLDADLDFRDEIFNKMLDKFKNLPKLKYYVEEVRTSIARQNEFIKRGSSNVNVYFIPNNKSPIDGGKFYNVYVNRATNLQLEEILPLDLDSIVPPNMDIDSIEWYVQEHADKTFKTAGGIILNKDESIGKVNIFKPADGKIGITPEEKDRYEKIEDLSRRLKSITEKSKAAKEAFLKSQESIDEEINTIENAMTLLLKKDDDNK